jgi:valyl-tRNA synthetase
VLGEVRKAKTVAQVSMRAEVAHVVVRDTGPRLAALAAARDDVRDAGRITDLFTEQADQPSVSVELAEA